jgi:hypothetical protein
MNGIDSSSLNITSFSFKDLENGLNKSYTAIISGTTITVSLPYAIMSSAIPTFVHDGVSVSVDGISQESGVTKNNFTNQLTYIVHSANGSSKSYTIIAKALFPIPDTGQISCYDTSGAISCTGSSGAFPSQDADHTNKPNIRTLSGPILHPLTNDYTTTDKLTGLIWKTCMEGYSYDGNNCTGSATPSSWTASSCDYLNISNSGVGYAGKKNWRLPTIYELANVINFQNFSPAIDSNHFPGVSTYTFWSGTTLASSPGANYWYLNFVNGEVNQATVATSENVRCVSGDYPPTAQTFTDNTDGTVFDNNSGLIWQKCLVGQTGDNCQGSGNAGNNYNASLPNWTQALNSCNVTLNNRKFRLPNVNELRSLVNYTISSGPAVNPVHFPAAVASSYWTSSTYVGLTTYSVLVSFDGGYVFVLAKSSTSYARCVSDEL